MEYRKSNHFVKVAVAYVFTIFLIVVAIYGSHFDLFNRQPFLGQTKFGLIIDLIMLLFVTVGFIGTIAACIAGTQLFNSLYKSIGIKESPGSYLVDTLVVISLIITSFFMGSVLKVMALIIIKLWWAA